MAELNIITGLSGVGKSTVLEEAMLLSKKDYELINYGDKMLETAKERGDVKTRDEMKELSSDRYREIQNEAAEEIAEIAEEKDVLLDTHAAIKSPYGYIPGLPKQAIERFEPDKIIMITASSKQIYKRSQKDSDRDREHDSVEDVQLYKEVSREMASTAAVLSGAYLQVIHNKSRNTKAAANKLLETLRN